MDYLKQLGVLALGSRLKRVSDEMFSQVAKVYQEKHVELEPRLFPLFMYLQQEGQSSVTQVAEDLNLTHPAVVQMARDLERKGYLLKEKNQADKRSSLLSLSADGQTLSDELAPLWKSIQKSLATMLDDLDCDFMKELDCLERSLAGEGLHKSVMLAELGVFDEQVRLIPWRSEYASEFEKLNVAWLKEFSFEIEEIDRKYFCSPESEILSKGGHMLVAARGSKIIGVCALIPRDKHQFELAKMAVSKEARGSGVGKVLLQEAIRLARLKGHRTLYLETNKRLAAAIALYRKAGFEEVSLCSSDYGRADYAMQLSLT